VPALEQHFRGRREVTHQGERADQRDTQHPKRIVEDAALFEVLDLALDAWRFGDGGGGPDGGPIAEPLAEPANQRQAVEPSESQPGRLAALQGVTRRVRLPGRAAGVAGARPPCKLRACRARLAWSRD